MQRRVYAALIMLAASLAACRGDNTRHNVTPMPTTSPTPAPTPVPNNQNVDSGSE